MQRKEILLRTVEKCPECGSLNLVRDYDTGRPSVEIAA